MASYVDFCCRESANTQFRLGAPANAPHVIHSLGVADSLGAKPAGLVSSHLDKGERQAIADFNAELRYIGRIALQFTWKRPCFRKLAAKAKTVSAQLER